jgi:hypothetical protein
MKSRPNFFTAMPSLIAVVFISLMCSEPVNAKPKKFDFGCTMEETIRWANTKGGKACMRALDQAVIAGSNTVFNIFCGNTTAACCQVNTTTGEVSRCQVISATQQQPGVTGQDSNAGVVVEPDGTLTPGPRGPRPQKGGAAP